MDWSATINSYTKPSSIVEQVFLQRTLDKDYAFVRSFRLNASVDLAVLLAADICVERSVTRDTGAVVLGTCSDGIMLIESLPTETTITIASSDDVTLDELEASLRSRAPDTSAPGSVAVRTWHSSARGQQCILRDIPAPAWPTIAKNYPGRTRAQLDQLMSVTLPTSGGRLILWHGEPGTGKTTALRALMHEWESWCASQYIADPERFFAEPGYISDVLTRPTSTPAGTSTPTSNPPNSRWRLVIAEDADEYLRASVRRDTGAGLGRLLNLTDGVLGQGFNNLILLTTNEEIHRIHPALTRPGRCLARTEFTRITRAEARDWLPEGSEPPERDLTLAELFEHAGDLERIGDTGDQSAPIGHYL